jgi:CarD family transcriptional regulator
MFQIGDVVVYTTYGICRVENIIEMNFNGNLTKYYVLVPLSEAKTELTIPVENPITMSRLHGLLKENEINEIIDEIPYLETFWINNDNERKKAFNDIIKKGNRKDTLQMLKSVKKHQLSLKDKVRKLHACDEQVMHDAEKLIVDEFSYVLKKEKIDVYNIVNENLLKNI